MKVSVQSSCILSLLILFCAQVPPSVDSQPASRQAPFCIDTSENQEASVIRFKPIFDFYNSNSDEFVPVTEDIHNHSSIRGFIRKINYTRITIDAVEPDEHPLKVLRHWIHVHITAGTALEGLYVQTVVGPIGVPKGQFVTNFDCKDCSVPTSELDATTVGCKYRPISAMMHPNVMVIGGRATSNGSFSEAHFHFTWLDHPMDEFVFFQFLIVAVKSFKCMVFETYYTNSLEFVYITEPAGLPSPFYYGWTKEDITCHRFWGVDSSAHQLGLIQYDIHQRAKIRYNREYDECIVKGNKIPEKLCPPGLFLHQQRTFDANDLNDNRLDYSLENAIEPCRECGQFTQPIDPCENNPNSECCPGALPSTTTTSTTTTSTTTTTTTTTIAPTTISVPTVQTTITSPTVQTTVPAPTVQTTVTARTVQTTVTAPTVQTTATAPTVQTTITTLASIITTSGTPETITVLSSTDGSPESSTFPNKPTTPSPFTTAAKKTSMWAKQVLLRLHGFSMIFCWALPASMGYFYARFMKESRAIRMGAAFFGIGDWLVTHINFVYLSLFGLIAGIFLVFNMDTETICEVFDGAQKVFCLEETKYHVLLGGLAMGFFFFAYASGWWRPEDPNKRSVVILIHVIGGYGSKYLSLLSVFTTNVDPYVIFCWIISEVLFLAVFILATVGQCIADSDMGIYPKRKWWPVLEGIETMPYQSCDYFKSLILVGHYFIQITIFVVIYFVYL